MGIEAPQQIQNPIEIVSGAEIALSLANEGVPVRSIARALKTPSSEVYDQLNDAVITGKLIELPQSDWPPGSRNARKIAGPAVLQHKDPLLRLAVGKIFQLTRLQAAVFVTILRRPEISKVQVHHAVEEMRTQGQDPTDPKMVDVVICHIRKRVSKKPHNIEIKTLWGQGYSLSAENRDRALTIIEAHLAPEGAAA